MTTPPPIARDTPAARRGRWAYMDGQELDDCPYKGNGDYSQERREWMAGWLDASTETKLSKFYAERFTK